ncbi:short-chain dehydrogenase [Streptomyces carminius]|uniref:Short-chain dehydrogenase n=1 Tax=Streptomyces carminius TaxID=2665496 RepID=A0A2M8LSJ3_9ACTN|nr:SDR family NAD(P)-dependent oxidoreductase [Streptomyces carminius]PJE94908.1 short-chain dehydrogenase [Streptomyces carminius]
MNTLHRTLPGPSAASPGAPEPYSRTVAVPPGDTPGHRGVREALRSLGLRVVTGGTGGTGPQAREEPPGAHCAVRIASPWFGAPPGGGADGPLDRAAVLAAAERMCAAGGGRLVLVTDAGRWPALGVDPETAADQAADLHWWNELAARVAGRGVAANTVRIGYAPFLGHRLPAGREADLLRCQAVRRPVAPEDLAGALSMLLSRAAGNIVGETVPLDGGLERVVVPFGGTGGSRHGPPAGSDPWSLRGRRFLITGASSGIGAACARELARLGADTVLAARRADRLAELAARLEDTTGRSAHAVPADLAEPGAGEALLREAERVAGPVDGLVHAAGALGLDGPGTGRAARERLYRLNLFSLVELAEELTAGWARSGVRGVIVPIGSISAQITPVPHVQNYGAGKAAVSWFSSHLAMTAARHGIRVNTVLPAGVTTPMKEAADPAFVEASMRRVPSGRFSTVEEVAALVSYLAAPVSDYLTGTQLRICGGVGTLRPLPELVSLHDHPGGDGRKADE